jgi:hypothetical protein
MPIGEEKQQAIRKSRSYTLSLSQIFQSENWLVLTVNKHLFSIQDCAKARLLHKGLCVGTASLLGTVHSPPLFT